jgi:hypothetical protein
LRFLLDDKTVEAFDELIAFRQVAPAPGDVEEILPQLRIGRFPRPPLGVGRTGDALGDVIAQRLQHQPAPMLLRSGVTGFELLAREGAGCRPSSSCYDLPSASLSA